MHDNHQYFIDAYHFFFNLSSIDTEVIERRHPLVLSLAKDVKLGFYTVPIGNRTTGRRVTVHYGYGTPIPCVLRITLRNRVSDNQHIML